MGFSHHPNIFQSMVNSTVCAPAQSCMQASSSVAEPHCFRNQSCMRACLLRCHCFDHLTLTFLCLRLLCRFPAVSAYAFEFICKQAPDDDLALQRLMSLTRNRSHDAFNAFAQQQFDSAAAAEQQNARRVSYFCCASRALSKPALPFWFCMARASTMVQHVACCLTPSVLVVPAGWRWPAPAWSAAASPAAWSPPEWCWWS